MRIVVLGFWFTISSLASPLPEDAYTSLLAQHGLKRASQAYCYEDPSGEVRGEHIDQQVIPASVTKLYTTYVALKTWGPEFRYTTRFEVRSGTAGARLHISGDRDGYFQNDQLYWVLNQLSQAGISDLREISFDGDFYLNLNLDAASVRADLIRVFQASTWKPERRAEYADFVRRARELGLRVSDLPPAFSVGRVGLGVRPLGEPAAEVVVRSLPVLQLLKDMNVHSTNRFAKAVFLRLGDAAEFNRILRQDLGATEAEMEFSDGSGGQSNHTTCRITLRLVKELQGLLESRGYRLQDAMSVGGMDGGTLRKRFLGDSVSGAVLGKTGTLPDIGASTLAGAFSSEQGQVFYGIFNRYSPPKLDHARNFQDGVVDALVKAHSGKRALEHTPWTIDVLRGL